MKVSGIVILLLVGVALGELGSSILNSEITLSTFSEKSFDQNSPGDWVDEKQIIINPNRITLEIEQASLAGFTNTKSMDPTIDSNANAIYVKPKSGSELKPGDIIYYESDYGKISHRIAQTGQDEKGWFAIAKGDNSDTTDPEKIRFGQVKGVIVGIIY